MLGRPSPLRKGEERPDEPGWAWGVSVAHLQVNWDRHSGDALLGYASKGGVS